MDRVSTAVIIAKIFLRNNDTKNLNIIYTFSRNNSAQ